MKKPSYTVGKEKSKLGFLCTATSAVAAIAAITGVIAVLLSRDLSSRYLGNDLAACAFYLAIAIGISLSITSLIIFKSQAKETSAPQTTAQRILTIITSAALLASALTVVASDAPSFIKAISLTSALIASLACLISEKSGGINIALVGAYAKTVFCILVISVLYLDMKIEMNSPFKLAIQFAAASVSLTALCDARRIIGGVSAKISVAAKIIVCLLCFAAGAIAISGVIFKGDLIPVTYLIYSVYFIAEAILALVSLWAAEIALHDSI